MHSPKEARNHQQGIATGRKSPWTQSQPLSTHALNLTALGLAMSWLCLIGLSLPPEGGDFQQYWQAAVNLRHSGDPYATTVSLSTQKAARPDELKPGYPNPPLLAYLVQPLTLLEQRQAKWVWFGINCAALGAFIVLSLWLSGSGLARRYWGVVLLATLYAPPTGFSLQLGQISIILALFIVASYAVARYASLAGLLVALASLIKLYPALMGIYFLLCQPRRVALWGLLSGALLLTLSVCLYGVAPYEQYITKVLLGGFYPYAAEFNISIVGFWDRLLVAGDYGVPLVDTPALARALAALSSAALLGACIWVSRATADDQTRLLCFSLWLCTMLLLAPINGVYNLVLLLLPLLAVLRTLENGPDRAVRNWLILATIFTCWPPAWSDRIATLHNVLHTGWGLLLLTPAFYGLLLYVALLIYLLRRAQVNLATAGRPR